MKFLTIIWAFAALLVFPATSQSIIVPSACNRGTVPNGKIEILFASPPITRTVITSEVPQGTYRSIELIPFADRYRGFQHPSIRLRNLGIYLQSTNDPIGPVVPFDPTEVFNAPIKLPSWQQTHDPGLSTAYFEPNANWIINFNQPFIHDKSNLIIVIRIEMNVFVPLKLAALSQPNDRTIFRIIEGIRASHTINDITDFPPSIQYDPYYDKKLTFVVGPPSFNNKPPLTHTDFINIGVHRFPYNVLYHSQVRDGPYLGKFVSDAFLGTYRTDYNGFLLFRFNYIPEAVGIPLAVQRIRINNQTGLLEGAGMISYVSVPYIYEEIGNRRVSFWSNFNEVTTLDCPVLIFHR